MVISTNAVEITYILSSRCQSQEEMMRVTPYQQRPSYGRSAVASRWTVLLNILLVTVAFVFVGAITFGLLG